jgi:hypothetical protein
MALRKWGDKSHKKKSPTSIIKAELLSLFLPNLPEGAQVSWGGFP